MKELEDGSKALGFFNHDTASQSIEFNPLSAMGFKSRQHVRDLWRQTNLPDIKHPMKESFKVTVPAHGVQLYKLTSVN